MAITLVSGRPCAGMSYGSDGLSMMEVQHIVERRCGFQRVAGFYADVWVREGSPYPRAEVASQAADLLRSQGFTVRVRPVVL